MNVQRKWWAAALFAAVLIVPTAVAFLRPQASRQVEMQPVERREVRPSILASGTLVYKDQAQLTPEVIGKVDEILAKEGDVVRKGQIVLRLNPQSFRAEVAQQEAIQRQSLITIERQRLSVANQERELERYRKLEAAGMVEVSKFDSAKYQLDLAQIELRASAESLRNAEAQLALARERLAKTEIQSPLGGRVTTVSIKAGETAVASSTGIAGSSLMTIANTDSIMAEVSVDEADIAQIASGQGAAIYAAAFPDKLLSASVESVSLAPKQVAQGQGRTYVVKTRLLDIGAIALRTGMSCRAEIYTGKREKILSAPIQAVLVDGDDKKARVPARYVFVNVDGKAEKRTVEVGAADDSFIEIRSGLKEGELVVAGPERELKKVSNGDRLQPLAQKKT